MDRASVVPRPGVNPLPLVWVNWLLGPACFALCAALNDGEPDCFLALLAVAGHGAAVVLTVVMAASARFRRCPEFWLMVGYWIALAGVFLCMASKSPLGRVVFFTVLGWVALVPLAGVARVLLGDRRMASRG